MRLALALSSLSFVLLACGGSANKGAATTPAPSTMPTPPPGEDSVAPSNDAPSVPAAAPAPEPASTPAPTPAPGTRGAQKKKEQKSADPCSGGE